MDIASLTYMAYFLAYVVYFLGVAYLCSLAYRRFKILKDNESKTMYVVALVWPVLFVLAMVIDLIRYIMKEYKIWN